MPEEADLFEALIDRIAEAVVRKIDERQKIDLIAEAVLARLEERGLAEGQEGTTSGEVQEEEIEPPAKKVTKPRGLKAADRTGPKSSAGKR